MKVSGLTRTKLKIEIPPSGIKFGTDYKKSGQTIWLDNPYFIQEKLPASEYLNYKFVGLKLDGKVIIFRILPRKGINGKRPIESICGSRCVVHHEGNNNELTFSSFADAAKINKFYAAGNLAFIMPELSPAPDENDTRIVLHNQLLDKSYAYGKVYRYFSLDDKDLLIEKYVILELPYGEKRIAIIKEINKETKNVVFDIVRVGVITEFENEKSKYGVFEGTVIDDTFTAYEYFIDVSTDYFTKVE